MSVNTTNPSRVVASVAACGLVLASAGFGAVYAYQVGVQHGIALAGLTVLFAVALELIKPLAIHGALQSLGSWRTWPRAIALGILGAVAVAYSLTAEIALTASSKADLVAMREQGTAGADSAKIKYDQALDELKLIHPSRTVPEVEADILRTTDLKRIAKLKGEKARTERREKLQAIVSGYTPGTRKESDPGTAAVGTYLAAMGLPMPSVDLARWLTLVPVLALEIGSALAMVLVGSMCGSGGSAREPVATPVDITPADTTTRNKDAVARLLLTHLRDNGGSLAGSQRQLAKALGTSKPTIQRSLQGLVTAGVISAVADKTGTAITLMP